MSNVTDAVLQYILPRLTKAERAIMQACSAAIHREGDAEFEAALKIVRQCRRAVVEDNGGDSAVALRILDAARASLMQISGEHVPGCVQQAIELIDNASVILRPVR